MKTYKKLTDFMLSDENMDVSLNDSTKKKKKRPNVQRVIANKENLKVKNRDDILNKKLTPQIHKARMRLDTISNKIRLTYEPYFTEENPEQWLHYILMNTLIPIIKKGMYDYSCGSVKGRGTHYGKKRIEKFIKNNPKEIKYCVKWDIKHFFENVSPEILYKKFEKIIKDETVLYLIRYVLGSNIGQLENGEIVKVGLPIGYYTSQWFANYYLQEFDHFVTEKLKVKCFVRYEDDMSFFCRNKKLARKNFEEIKIFLKSLGLEIKSNYQIFRFDYIDKNGKRKGRPLDIMGFKIYRDKTIIRRKPFLKSIRKARKLKKQEHINWYEASQMVSHTGKYKHTNTYNAYKKYIESNVDICVCKKIISEHAKKQAKLKK